MRNRIFVATFALLVAAGQSLFAQRTEEGPAAGELMTMVNTERAFAARAREANWRDAFLEYFVDGIQGFEGEDIKARLRSRPAPPKELQFWWEPRFGDIAASGDLGWLTGPVRTALPGRDPDFGNYTSVWKRQPDGSYKVIEDVGVSIPQMAPFPPGFNRAPVKSRYAGSEKGARAQESLSQADGRLTAALRASGPAKAYADAAAPFARVHRQRVMPIVGREAIAAWAATEPAWSEGETRFAEVAASADLGYSWGSYVQAASGSKPAPTGYYLRIWSRDAAGRWHVVLDVTQPKVLR